MSQAEIKLTLHIEKKPLFGKAYHIAHQIIISVCITDTNELSEIHGVVCINLQD